MPSPKLDKVDRLYREALHIVSKEIAHLRVMSISEKLPAKFAQDLVRYVNLLAEIKEAQEAAKAEHQAKIDKAAKEAGDAALIEAAKGG